MNTEDLIIIGLLALGGYLIYQNMQSGSQQQSSTASGGSDGSSLWQDVEDLF